MCLFLGTTSLRIHYRPLRIGFLVREGNIDDLIKAAELNTALFGGIYNPIIPAGSSLKLAEYLIRLFNCDVLHPIIDDEELSSNLSMYPWLSWPNNYRGGSELFIKSREKPTLGVLDVFPIIKYYWDQDFRYSDVKSNVVFPSWEPDDPLNKLFTLQFGKYPTDMAYDYSSIYIERMRAEKISIGQDPIPEGLTQSITPLALTGRELEVFYDEWPHDGIYVGGSKLFPGFIKLLESESCRIRHRIFTPKL